MMPDARKPEKQGIFELVADGEGKFFRKWEGR